MNELKKDGIIKHTGVSVYSYHGRKEVAESGFDAIQVPINIFDWAQISNGVLDALEKSGMMVLTRSVYLQGLIFKYMNSLPKNMD